MNLLNSYSEFITRVIELGFMPLSDIIPGLPSVSHETRENQWHTGDPDTDPWQWKDRAVTEKQLAFGCSRWRTAGIADALPCHGGGKQAATGSFRSAIWLAIPPVWKNRRMGSGIMDGRHGIHQSGMNVGLHCNG